MLRCDCAPTYIDAAVQSVLSQPECLELLLVLENTLEDDLNGFDAIARSCNRVRLIKADNYSIGDSLNLAFDHARGSLIGWLNADSTLSHGALARAVEALESNPDWLMVYGECEEYNEQKSVSRRYPTLPPEIGCNGFSSHCFISYPAVVFRRSMGLILGPFDGRWMHVYAYDFFIRAFDSFSHRIGYLPHCQARVNLDSASCGSYNRADAVLEACKLLASHFGSANHTLIHDYAIHLQHQLAESSISHLLTLQLSELFEQARPWLSANAMLQLQRMWLQGQTPQSLQSTSCSWKAPGVSPEVKILTPFLQRPYGVNLIGHAFEIFGIGEDIRMAVRALQSANVPCCVIYHPAANGAICSERCLEPLLCTDPSGGPYAFNLVCMAAPIHARWLRHFGLAPLRERYTITSWPWETMMWPDPWNPLLQVADELWPSSSFTAAAFSRPAAEASLPLRIMPMAAEIPNPDRFTNISSRLSARVRHDLPLDAILFAYSFDFNSTAIRKNPMATLEAFQLAFPLPHLRATYGLECSHHALSDKVALMIKTFLPQSFTAEWHWLMARAAEDSRIHLVSECLEREELLSLYGCCDVFLSLHRSEGFGRGLAEALQLGLDVIATGFGGNVDFCLGDLAHLVRCRPLPIPHSAYPFADGQVWAEPDLNHAAELCCAVAERRLSLQSVSGNIVRDPSSDLRVLTSYRRDFSTEAAGLRYRSRLDELWACRNVIDQRLRWRLDRSPMKL